MYIKTNPGSRRGLAPVSGYPISNFGEPGPSHEERLMEMAKWPFQAYSAWKRLNAADRTRVVLQMAAQYGVEFARKFLKEVAKGRPQDIVQHHYGPGVGPNEAKLIDMGYKLAQKSKFQQWWVHPSGKSIYRILPSAKPASAAKPPVPTKPKPRSPQCQQMDELAANICRNAERICKIAAEVNDEKSLATCAKARASCRDAQQRSSTCDQANP